MLMRGNLYNKFMNFQKMRQREHFIFHDGENYQSKGHLLEKTQKKFEKAENCTYTYRL